jgi:hypothetical protein
MFFSSNSPLGDIFQCGGGNHHPRSESTLFESDIPDESITRRYHSPTLQHTIERSLTFDEDDVSFLYEQRRMTTTHHDHRSSSECIRTPPPPSSPHQSSNYNDVYQCYNRIPPPPPTKQTKCMLYMEEPWIYTRKELFVPSLEEMMMEEDEEEDTNERKCLVTLLPRNADSIFKWNEIMGDPWEDNDIHEQVDDQDNAYHSYDTPTTATSSRKSFHHHWMSTPSPNTVAVSNIQVRTQKEFQPSW